MAAEPHQTPISRPAVLGLAIDHHQSVAGAQPLTSPDVSAGRVLQVASARPNLFGRPRTAVSGLGLRIQFFSNFLNLWVTHDEPAGLWSTKFEAQTCSMYLVMHELLISSDPPGNCGISVPGPDSRKSSTTWGMPGFWCSWSMSETCHIVCRQPRREDVGGPD